MMLSQNERYKPDLHPEMLDKHLGDGWSFFSFGGKVHVSNKILQRWLHDHKEFRDVYLKHYGKKAIYLYKKYSN